MVTAAIGAEKYYTTENNAARHENIEEARALDFKILNAWIGHPRVRIIDNSTDFPSKLNRAVAIISQMIGAPRPSHSIRKFIISNSDPDSIIKKLPLHVETFEIEQTYLMRAQDDDDSSSGYNYLRRRGQQGIYTYTLSAIREPGREFVKSLSSRSDADRDEEQIVLERALSGREYVSLLQQRDTSRIVVKKKVHSFVWNNVYYELQTFQEPDLGLSILNCELEPELTPQLPTFFDVEQEVTGAKEFSSYYISKRFKEIRRRWTEDEILKSVATSKPKAK
jgi:CYTH domain-containing protein